MKIETLRNQRITKMEIWKDVPGIEGHYQASNKGVIRIINAGRKPDIVKQYFNTYGYKTILVRKNSKWHTKLVHRLVGAAFIPNLENKPQINHKNGIKSDNILENLEWVTVKENAIHAFKTGLRNSDHVRGIKNYNNKLTENNILTIRRNIFNKSQRQLAKEFKVSQVAIWKIMNRKTWKYI